MSGVYAFLLILVGPIVFRKVRSITSKKRTLQVTLLPNKSSPTSILFHFSVLLHSIYQFYQLTSRIFNPTSDIFKSQFSINQSTSSIRSTLLSLEDPPRSLLPYSSLGLSSNHQDITSLQLLLERLSRFEGRIIYLLVGSNPLLDCVYCVKRDDFVLYYLFNNVLPAYVGVLLLIGLISISFRSRGNLDAIFRFVGFGQSGKEHSDRLEFKNSNRWRTLAVSSILIGFLFEAFILLYQATITTNGGWLNHYNHNLSLLRTLHFLILSISVLIFQTEKTVPIHQRTMIKMEIVEKDLGAGVLGARAGRIGRELNGVGEEKKVAARIEIDQEEKSKDLENKKTSKDSKADGERNGIQVTDEMNGSVEKGDRGGVVKANSQPQSNTSKLESDSDSDSKLNLETQFSSSQDAIPNDGIISTSYSTSTTDSQAPSTSNPLPTASTLPEEKLTLEELLSKASQASIPTQSIEALRKQCDEVAKNAWAVSDEP